MGDSLNIEVKGAIAVLTMNRPDKRNAMSDGLLAEIDAFFRAPNDGVRVAVMHGAGGHFCSGLDLSEHVARDAEGTLYHSRGWHDVMDRVLRRQRGTGAVESHDLAVPEGPFEIGCERGDAAASRWIGGDKRDRCH